jgi:type IV pilus assembly protein PilB
MSARRLLGQVLKDQGAVHEGMIQEALMQQRDKGGRIGQILMELGHIGRGELARALADQAGLAFWDLNTQAPQQDAVAKVDLATARAFTVLPVQLKDKVLTIAIADPVNVSMLADLAFTTGCEVQGVIADEELIQKGLDRFYR